MMVGMRALGLIHHCVRTQVATLPRIVAKRWPEAGGVDVLVNNAGVFVVAPAYGGLVHRGWVGEMQCCAVLCGMVR